jgi:hypothetical protein
MTLLMWRNHFTCDILAEHGSAYIHSLCNGAFVVHQRRGLPSGRPPEEVVRLSRTTHLALEYAHFKARAAGAKTDLSSDIWLHGVLARLCEAVRGQ